MAHITIRDLPIGWYLIINARTSSLYKSAIYIYINYTIVGQPWTIVRRTLYGPYT